MMLRKDWNFCLSKCIQRYANISKGSNELFTLIRKYLFDFGFLFGFYNVFILDWILRKAIKAVKIWRSWAFLISMSCRNSCSVFCEIDIPNTFIKPTEKYMQWSPFSKVKGPVNSLSLKIRNMYKLKSL